VSMRIDRKFVDQAEFHALARAGKRPDCGVIRTSTADPQPAADGSRKITFTFSDETVDRMGDTIAANGWDLSGFKSNPVALWSHDSSAPPIGLASGVGPVGKKLMGTIEFAPAETYAFADTIYRLLVGKYLRAVSVGFIPREWEFVNDPARPMGISFTKQELLEISVCAVPANPNALSAARAKGIDTRPLRNWAQRELDERRARGVSRQVIEDLLATAKEPVNRVQQRANAIAIVKRRKREGDLINRGFSMPLAKKIAAADDD
jgi:HK97 family phage prohead protease